MGLSGSNLKSCSTASADCNTSGPTEASEVNAKLVLRNRRRSIGRIVLLAYCCRETAAHRVRTEALIARAEASAGDGSLSLLDGPQPAGGGRDIQSAISDDG